jgi:hypothetical protein
VPTWNYPSAKEEWVLLKADVSKAHRRIKVHPSDWKFQVAVNKNQFWVNKVGTYGMASAQLYWGRMAALIVRILYGLFPSIDWQFVYVDDFAWLLRHSHYKLLTTAILITMAALGVPLSWKKTAVNHINVWLGFIINTRVPSVQMAPIKHALIMALLQRLASGVAHTSKEIESLLGRLQWATAACPTSRPFLQPLWAWKKMVGKAGRPGKLVRQIALWLVNMFAQTRRYPSQFAPLTQWHGASDARADDDSAMIGGWIAPSRPPVKSQCKWFSIPITRSQHPWAYDKESPQKRIAALELYGTLLLVKALCWELRQQVTVSLKLPLQTDNQGNAFSLLSHSSRQWPNSAILMELFSQINSRGVHLSTHHVHRELNQWADDLSNGLYEGFNTALQIRQETLEMDWKVLPRLFSLHSSMAPGNV